jgi:hypothetical protein
VFNGLEWRSAPRWSIQSFNLCTELELQKKWIKLLTQGLNIDSIDSTYNEDIQKSIDIKKYLELKRLNAFIQEWRGTPSRSIQSFNLCTELELHKKWNKLSNVEVNKCGITTKLNIDTIDSVYKEDIQKSNKI